MNKYINDYKDLSVDRLKRMIVDLCGNIIDQNHPRNVVERIAACNHLIKNHKTDLNKRLHQTKRDNFDYNCARRFCSKFTNSVKRCIEFDLTLDDFKKLMKTQRCRYTGVRLDDNEYVIGETEKKENPNYRTFDRIDAAKGYTAKNTVVCTRKANKLKNLLFEADHDLKLTIKQAENFINTIKRVS